MIPGMVQERRSGTLSLEVVRSDLRLNGCHRQRLTEHAQGACFGIGPLHTIPESASVSGLRLVGCPNAERYLSEAATPHEASSLRIPRRITGTEVCARLYPEDRVQANCKGKQGKMVKI